jgi:hypothetical protein
MNGCRRVDCSNQPMSAAVVGSGTPSTMAARGTPMPSPKRMKSSGCETLQPEIRPVSSS